jgi:hypothetical protein
MHGGTADPSAGGRERFAALDKVGRLSGGGMVVARTVA